MQPEWVASFNTEALRRMLASAFPNAGPSSWWKSGSLAPSKPVGAEEGECSRMVTIPAIQISESGIQVFKMAYRRAYST
jgi:hypothetical protein